MGLLRIGEVARQLGVSKDFLTTLVRHEEDFWPVVFTVGNEVEEYLHKDQIEPLRKRLEDTQLGLVFEAVGPPTFQIAFRSDE